MTAPAEPTAAFDPCGPLPTGVTILEASAGTGKTYAIATLAARYVAGGTPLEKLLLVTFTRAAAAELRDRVRQRIAHARAVLDEALEAIDPGAADAALREHVGDEDPLLELFATGARAEVARRRDRLAGAIADFDAATITTTHGFCQEVLLDLGVAGDIDRALRVSEDATDLVEEVVDDLYVARFAAGQAPPPFGRGVAGQVAEVVVANPSAPLAPVGYDTADGEVALRRQLGEDVRAALDRRKRALALMTFDDLVVRLREALHRTGGEVAETLRARYDVVLVDEFQDTDPDQWAILREAFVDPRCTLVLIGDPKQAIYAFRGGDVYAYLDAAAVAGTRQTLGTNWRSDGGLLKAYDALFDGARLGHEDIAYRPTRAVADHQDRGLLDAPSATPLRIRVVARQDAPRTRSGWSEAPGTRAFVARDVAADIARLLASGAATDDVEIRAGDVAVLVRKNVQAREIKAALDAAGVPAVLNSAGSVFETEAATDWLTFLEALERPEQLRRARAAALTAFLGWGPLRVATADVEAWDDLQQQLHAWAGILRRDGVAALMETVSQAASLAERILGQEGGERALTDLRHVAELLHGAVVDDRLGITALAGWLRRRIASVYDEAGGDDRARRLESDKSAVQVLTIHRSKGLEYGVVYCPFLWDPFRPREEGPVVFHDTGAGNVRTIDVAMASRDPAFARHRGQATQEQLGEERRLAYVALTRAKHQAVLWWAPSYYASQSPLARLIFDRDYGDAVKDAGTGSKADAFAQGAGQRLRALQALAPDVIAVERAGEGAAVRPPELEARAVPLATATFDRGLDERWRRSSYSSITAGAYEARVASEVEEEAAVGADEPAGEAPVAVEAAVDAPVVPLADMPAGTRVGTFVHAVLEATDFAAADLGVELGERIGEARRRRAIDVGDGVVLAAGLRAAIETPLGPLLGGRRLRDLAPADRLDELAFELPLAGGDDPSGTLTVAAITRALRAHLAPGDPLAGYADRLDDAPLQADLRGFLTGTIDLVARWADGNYAIVDYKTNKLAAAGDPLTTAHHRPAVLAEEMQRSHYALQALLYGVALHRYLRSRGVSAGPPAIAYLFLRGMVGPDAPRDGDAPYGVFAWRPPAALLPALSDALDGVGG